MKRISTRVISFFKGLLRPVAKQTLLVYGVRILWWLHLDSAISRLIAFLVISNNREECARPSSGVVLLAMDRRIFNDDKDALRQYQKAHHLSYTILSYPSFVRALLTKAVWPAGFAVQTGFYAHRNHYREFTERMVRIYEGIMYFIEKQTGIRVRVILTGLIDYAQEYPWVFAIQKCGGVFVSLYKESIIYSKFYKEETVEIYTKAQFRYDGDAVLFYNEYAKDVFIAARAVTASQSFVTGCPRVDRLVEISESPEAGQNQEEPFILVAAFQDPSYGAATLWREVLQALYRDEILRTHITIKCRDVREIVTIKRSFPDFQVVTGPMEYFLAKRPRVLVGFNSTSCLDALIADVAVVVPWWAEASDLGLSSGRRMEEAALLSPATSTFHEIAYNREMLVGMLHKYLDYGTKIPGEQHRGKKNSNLRKFIEEKYSALDGKNAERFFRFLDHFLKNHD